MSGLELARMLLRISVSLMTVGTLTTLWLLFAIAASHIGKEPRAIVIVGLLAMLLLVLSIAVEILALEASMVPFLFHD